jgi:hypothetical protein
MTDSDKVLVELRASMKQRGEFHLKDHIPICASTRPARTEASKAW